MAEMKEGERTVSGECRHPAVKWAQRSDKLFITVELPDAKNVKLKLEPEGKFFFSATAGADNVPYEVDLDLFDKINVDESKTSTTSRSIVYLVKKAEDKWWSRLIKQEGVRPVFLKVDWDKWVDEDEEDTKPGTDMDFGDIDFSKLNMGGGPSDFDADVPEGDYDSDTEEEEVREEENSAHNEPKATVPPSTEPEAKA
ncbi:co-chaperone protein p23-1 isoform X1 [Nicotiana tabacum]|uniref:Co-chaperone protein p23-1 isoform X1 n=1 Tax=Nicotiana tabacum TaxID=4097 RepID=A0AC58SVB5_TOBAC